MLKEEIIQTMSGRRYSGQKLESFVKYFPSYDVKEIEQAIKELKEEYVVMESSKGNLMLASQNGYFKGQVISVYNEHILVKIDKYDDAIRVNKNYNQIVYPKDEVLIHLAEDETLEKIIKHNTSVLVGEVALREDEYGNKEYYIIPQNKKLKLNLVIDPLGSQKLVNGYKVTYEIVSNKLGVQAVVKKIIGYKDDPMVDILAYVIEAGAPSDFSEACLKEANDVSRDVNENDIKERVDFRDRTIFTIDGDDAKDFDDAVEVYAKDDGGFHVGVHIADVSAYVKEGGAIDLDVQDRGTSIYLIYSVIPMLPQILSNGKCSLVPHEDRLTMSFLMDIDEKGNLVDGKIELGVINSKKRFTYNEVNKIVEDKDPKVMEENKEFLEMLDDMVKASAALRENRKQRGELSLDVPEAKVITDDKGHPIDIVPRNRGLGEKAIEDLMILTNEFVASTFTNMNLPFMYRVHEAPEEEKIERFIKLSSSVSSRKPRNKVNGYESTNVNKILENEKDEVVRSVLSSLLLRSLPKAYYGPDNIGHFGLASEAYMQSTSPIRRYPDLIAHRLIKKYLFEPEKFDKLDFAAIYEYLREAGETTSMQERRAEQLERDVTKMKMAEYMEDKVGQIFKGKISGFSEKGMYVELANTIEGYVKFEYLTDDMYIYDKDRMLAFGKRTHQILRIGSDFEIRVARASKSEALIDFAPSNYRPKKTENKDKKGKRNIKRKGKRH